MENQNKLTGFADLTATRRRLTDYCLTLPGVYEDYPFHDANWTVMRCGANRKTFALIYERNGQVWLNVKSDPMEADFWRQAYASVQPGYHMNKTHWNMVIMDDTVPEEVVENLIRDSYTLVKPKGNNKGRM